MKKLIIFPIFIITFCLGYFNNYCFADSLKGFDLATYSVFCKGNFLDKDYDGILSLGSVKMYNYNGKNKPPKISQNVMCEQAVLDTNFEPKIYIKNSRLKLIKTENVEGIKIKYYYCKMLPKKISSNGQVFNVVIAKKSDKYVVGYPAIMGSL